MNSNNGSVKSRKNWLPLFFGILYISLFVIFAKIYSYYSDEFYQSTDARENISSVLKNILTESLLDEVSNSGYVNCMGGRTATFISNEIGFNKCVFDYEFKFDSINNDDVHLWVRAAIRERGETFAQNFTVDGLLKMRLSETKNNVSDKYNYILSVEKAFINQENKKLGTISEEPPTSLSNIVKLVNMMKQMGMSDDDLRRHGYLHPR